MWRLLAVVVGVAVVWPQVSSKIQVWRGVKSSVNFPGDVTKQVFPGDSTTVCAMRASQTSWSNLFTHDENGCVLYDLPVDSNGDLKLSPGDTEVTTYTKYKDVCIEGEQVYEEGEEKARGCILYRCSNRVLAPVQQGTVCRAPFESYGGGCFLLHQVEMSWCNARLYCQKQGGDLAHRPSYDVIKSYLDVKATEETWVGVKAREWLDGTAIQAEQWATSDGEPNEDQQACARMKRPGDVRLADKDCGTLFHVLCHLG